MKTTIKIPVLLILLAIGLVSCKKNNHEPVPPQEEKKMEDLNIPADFDFATTRNILLHINDVEDGAKYDIYSLKSKTPDEIIYPEGDTEVVAIMDDLNEKVASGMTVSNMLTLKVAIPSYHKYLYIVRSKEGHFVREIIPVDDNTEITYTYDGSRNQNGFKSKSMNAENTDIIYSVNHKNKNLYSINLETGAVNLVAKMPYKSIACAVDRENGRVYVANVHSPYQLGYYDLNSGNFVIVGNLAGSFPRMDYNPADGLLYTSTKRYLNTIDPANAVYLQSYNISGIDKKGWGDLAFTEDGTMYILTKVGVYLCALSGNTVNATLITDNTFPTSLTSLAAGSNNHLYMSHEDSNGEIIDFDPSSGTWSYFNISQNIKINDFGIVRENTSGGNDSDGDGVIDIQDDYPDDPERAFNNYFPGEDLWATLAFEDLWPAKGDYDFNDMVVGYNINQVTSASNKVVDIISKFEVRHNGAGLHNGFAFQIPVDQTNVGSVTSTYSPYGEITLNGNGTISGQDLANILVFEDNWDVTGTEIDITVNFTTPPDATSVGVPPYNPYLIKDGDQAVEVHLPDMEPTAMADRSYFGTGDDTSDSTIGRYYKTSKNLPWGINIVYDFKWMKEKQEIINGYLHFADWAESGGTLYPDWYKDLPGYRDESFLDDDGQ